MRVVHISMQDPASWPPMLCAAAPEAAGSWRGPRLRLQVFMLRVYQIDKWKAQDKQVRGTGPYISLGAWVVGLLARATWYFVLRCCIYMCVVTYSICMVAFA